MGQPHDVPLAPGPDMLRLRLLGPPEITTGSGSPASLPAQSKRTALLVYLTLRRPRRLLSRERILGLLWPESSQSQARHNLRQALYQLRKTGGEELIAQQGHGLVGVDWDVLNCDVVQFEEAIAEGRLDDALHLYEGELLEGVQPWGVAADFEQWLDGERERLRRMALLAACERASMEAESGNGSRAAHYVRRAARFAPTDETILRRLLQILDRVGNLTEAKLLYEDTCRRMEEDLGIPLSPETRSLMRQLESRGLRETDEGQTTVSFRSLLGLEGGTRWRPLPRRPAGDVVVPLVVLLLLLALLVPQRREAPAASPDRTTILISPLEVPVSDLAAALSGALESAVREMGGFEIVRGSVSTRRPTRRESVLAHAAERDVGAVLFLSIRPGRSGHLVTLDVHRLRPSGYTPRRVASLHVDDQTPSTTGQALALAAAPLLFDPALAPWVDVARREAGAPAALGTFMEGIDAFRLGDVTGARDRFEAAAEAGTAFHLAWLAAAAAALWEGDATAARALLDRIGLERPWHAAAHLAALEEVCPGSLAEGHPELRDLLEDPHRATTLALTHLPPITDRRWPPCR